MIVSLTSAEVRELKTHLDVIDPPTYGNIHIGWKSPRKSNPPTTDTEWDRASGRAPGWGVSVMCLGEPDVDGNVDVEDALIEALGVELVNSPSSEALSLREKLGIL